MARHKTQIAVLLCVFLAVPTLRHTRSTAHAAYAQTRTYEDVYYLPPAQWLPVISLQYHAALADLLWARALVYFGDELGNGGQARHLFEYTDSMLRLDPSFKAVYRWIAVAAVYHPGEVGVTDVERAIHYLEAAVRRWPDDGELAWDLGSALRFELVPLLKDEEEKDKARLRGAEYLSAAARLGAGPPWLALTTANTFEKQGRREHAIRHLEEMYLSLSDPATKLRIQQSLAGLRSQAYADNLRAAAEAFERARRRDYPYMPPPLYLVLGPPPGPDWARAVASRFAPQSAQPDWQAEDSLPD